MTNIFFLGPHHPIFETIVKYPPEGYGVISDIKTSQYSGKDIKEYHDKYYIATKYVANSIYKNFYFPRIIPIPNENLFDIIFTINALPLTSKPFILGVETVFHLIGHHSYHSVTPSILFKFLKKAKAIIAISQASKESILNYLRLFKPENLKDISEKIEVVYPAIDTSYGKSVFYKKEEDEIFWILHVNTRPFLKGMKEIFEISTILGNQFDIGLRIKLTPRFVTKDVIKNIRRYMAKLSELGVKLHLKIGNLSREELFNQFYSRGDLFVLPTWMDSFGYVFLEAMSAGLPCVGTDLWAIPEIIGHDELLIHLPHKPYLTSPNLKYLTTDLHLKRYYLLKNTMRPKVIEECSKIIKELINNSNKNFGCLFYRETREGKFSIKQQQNKLKSIYEKALER